MVKEKITRLLQKLYEGVYEREEAIRLALLSSLAGESIFFLGPPGVAKSLVARKLKHAYKDCKAFEYLMTRFSTPDEVFGPVSIKQLKEEDRYIRLTDKYLPGAQIVFLDEIWKAGPPIQNALLTILNEKIYRNGEQEIKVDLRGLIAASNELPARDEGLEALWDRFLVRLIVKGVQSRELFDKMVSDTDDTYADNVPADTKITSQEYQEWSKAISQISAPKEILDLIETIRKKIVQRNEGKTPEEKIYISDRRWKKIIRLLRTSAFCNDRKAIDMMDFFLIAPCLWNKESQSEEMQQIVAQTIQENGYKTGLSVGIVANALKELKDDVASETQYEKTVKCKVPKEVSISGNKYYILRDTRDTD